MKIKFNGFIKIFKLKNILRIKIKLFKWRTFLTKSIRLLKLFEK
jgi:hypothetical protein